MKVFVSGDFCNYKFHCVHCPDRLILLGANHNSHKNVGMREKKYRKFSFTHFFQKKLPDAYIEVQDQVEMGGHTFWPFSLNNIFFSQKYFTMKAIQKMPETNWYDSQHIGISIFRHFHDHVNTLKTSHVFLAEFKSVKN